MPKFFHAKPFASEQQSFKGGVTINSKEGIRKEKVKERAEQRKEILERVKKVLIERLRLDLEPDEIADDSPLFGLGLGLDSVDALEIVVGIEQEFGISITDEDMQAFRSINTIVDFTMERLEGKEKGDEGGITQ